jgi:Ca2+-binding RTX toxin-like protein
MLTPAAPFQDATPTRFIYVSATGNNAGNGSIDQPYRTIQAAVDRATPGTAIMVREGVYIENVKLPSNGGGTVSAPIWLVSADGVGAAKVVAATATKSTIYGFGTDNYVVANFAVEGGKNGIQFSLSGTNFANTVQNIVVKGNIVTNSLEDGVKISQGINVHVIDNKISGSRDQGIDFVAVNNSVIARNEVFDIKSYSAVYAKGGSTDVLIEDNYIHHVAVDGIGAGGWTEPQYMWPGARDYEARNITIRGNVVEDVGKRAVNVLGAQNTVITDNFFEAKAGYLSVINLGSGGPLLSPPPPSTNTIIADNTFTRATHLVTVERGSQPPSVTGNKLGSDSGLTPSSITQSNLSINHTGTEAADRISGTMLADVIDGKGGADVMSGGAGNDRYVVDDAKDSIVERTNEGVDTVVLQGRSHTLAANVENVDIINGLGATVIGNSAANQMVGGAGDDTLLGGRGNDILTGGAGADRFLIEAGDGRDVITDFMAGVDTISLRLKDVGSFDELTGMMAQVGGDTVINLSATQSLTLKNVNAANLSSADFALGAAPASGFAMASFAQTEPTAARMTETGPAALQTSAKFQQKITGTGGVDFLQGTDRHDFIDARGGLDVMSGGRGDDTYVISSRFDRIVEKAGGGTDTAHVYDTSYVLDSFVENMEIRSRDGLEVDGNALANIIKGGSGNDVIAGNGGKDLLSGGRGSDSFVFRDLNDAGDLITDFELGMDQLDMRELLQATPGATLSIDVGATGTSVFAEIGEQSTLLVTLDKVNKAGLQLADLMV